MVSKVVAKIGKLWMYSPAYWRNLGQNNIFPSKIKKKMFILTKDYYIELLIPPIIVHSTTRPLVDRDGRPRMYTCSVI